MNPLFVDLPGCGPGVCTAGWGSVAYLALLSVFLPFGLHRLFLLWRRLSSGPSVTAAGEVRAGSAEDGGQRAGPGRVRAPASREDASGAREGNGGGPCRLPVVTVQIPLFNEAGVAERVVDAACRLRYPRDRLEIQVLDDSTDGTVERVRERVEAWRRRGVAVRHLRREDREGYKAGALARGTREARGEYFLVLDADFVPPPGLLHRLLPPFRDPGVGFVQAAWGHLNEAEGWLTRAQAALLDAHFAVEHEARCRSDLYFNFNGTAGMWRRECLEEAGGWSAETLTEDLDLSYRAQMAGWRGVYLDDVRVPAELPAGVAALEIQQRRWARGGLQTARKILPRLWRSQARAAVKLEATAHLTGHLLHPFTLLLGMALALPGRWMDAVATLPSWLHAGAVTLAVLPFLAFYGTAAWIRGAGPWRAARTSVEAMALGIGLGPALAAPVLRGLGGRPGGVFRRTPKRGDAAPTYGTGSRPLRTGCRILLGAALAAATARLLVAGIWAPALFTALFASGYLATAAASAQAGHAPAGEPEEEGSVDEQRERRRKWPLAGGPVGVEARVAEEDEARPQEPGTAAA